MDYLDLAYELKNSIKNDERFILLDKLEKEMKASFEVQSLYKEKEEKQKELDELLKYYSKESKEVRTALTKYIDASHALDMHPLVVKYLEAYQEVEHVIKDINDILFEDLKDKDSYAHCGR